MKNLPLIVGIALPLAFILVIVGVLYIPRLSITPAHDFLYTTGEAYYDYGPYRNTYDVKDGKLITEAVTPREGQQFRADAPDIYRYDVEAKTSTQIEASEAVKLKLAPGPSSPDGYSVEYRYSHDGVFELFGGGSDNGGYYVTKGGAGKRLPGVSVSGRGWSNDVRVIGWIIE